MTTITEEITTVGPVTRQLTPRDIQAALQAAEVSIYVTGFKNIFTASGTPAERNTGHKMTMKDGQTHPRVWIAGSELHLKPRGATIRFTITPDNYYPLGISFMRRPDATDQDAKKFSDQERLGVLNFGQITICPHEHTLDVTDFFKDDDADDRYKFSLIIQDGRTGAIGIIDPGIEHEPE